MSHCWSGTTTTPRLIVGELCTTVSPCVCGEVVGVQKERLKGGDEVEKGMRDSERVKGVYIYRGRNVLVLLPPPISRCYRSCGRAPMSLTERPLLSTKYWCIKAGRTFTQQSKRASGKFLVLGL